MYPFRLYRTRCKIPWTLREKWCAVLVSFLSIFLTQMTLFTDRVGRPQNHFDLEKPEHVAARSCSFWLFVFLGNVSVRVSIVKSSKNVYIPEQLQQYKSRHESKQKEIYQMMLQELSIIIKQKFDRVTADAIIGYPDMAVGDDEWCYHPQDAHWVV